MRTGADARLSGRFPAPSGFTEVPTGSDYGASHKNWIRNIRFSIINRPLSQ